MKCVNCPNPAHYSVVQPGVLPADYCNNCLPKRLQPRAMAGQLTLRTLEEEVVETPEPTPAPTQTKKKTAKKAAAPVPAPSEVSDENNQD